MTRWSRTVLAALALVAVVLVAGACGVPTHERARLADDDSVPFGLLDADREPVAGAGTGPAIIEVYLHVIGDDVLVPVSRRVERGSLSVALAELGRNPTDAESALDLRSPLADLDAVAGAEIEDRVAVVDLAASFRELARSDQLVAIAQIVLTATARADVDAVTFTSDGQPVEVPRGDGSLTSGILEGGDYLALTPDGVGG